MSNPRLTLPIIQDAISDVTYLFSLPEIYLRIRELMDDKNSVLDDFVRVVSTDPNLTASVLKIVNSAYYGFTGHIDSVHRALNLLGIGSLHDLVLSISAMDSFTMPNQIVKLSLFWRRSIYCGVLAKLIAENNKLKDSERLFVIGLLHEIGHLLFYFKFPEQSLLAINESAQSQRSLFQTEQDIFSIHYGQAGQRLMEAWSLPVNFQAITEFHPEPEKAQEYIPETAIIHIAHHYAIAKESGDDSQCVIDPLALQLAGSSPELMPEILIKADLMSAELEKMIIR